MATPKGQLVLHGYHTLKGTNTIVEPATYAVDWPNIPDDDAGSSQFTVDAGYDFHVQEMTHVSAGVTKGAHIPMKLQIQALNDRPWFIQPCFINSVSALQDAGLPRKLPVPRVLPATRIVNILFYDVTNA